jgi:hypothetical protein
LSDYAVAYQARLDAGEAQRQEESAAQDQQIRESRQAEQSRQNRTARQNSAQSEQDDADQQQNQAADLDKYKATVETGRANNAARTEALRQKRSDEFTQGVQKLIKSQE